jgi:hypothetical protein
VRINGLFVEGIDLRCHRGSARRNNVIGHRIDRRPVATGEEKPGPLIRKGAGDSTADATGSSVDHCNLVLQHGDIDTAIPAEWAFANGPVRQPAGVYT